MGVRQAKEIKIQSEVMYIQQLVVDAAIRWAVKPTPNSVKDLKKKTAYFAKNGAGFLKKIKQLENMKRKKWYFCYLF